jgi:hypothetical protein
MIRSTMYLTLAACVMAVPSAVVQQPTGYGQYVADEYGGTGGEGGSGRSGSVGVDSTRALEVILKASGVPNQNGKVAWPLAFRLLRADSRTEQLEAQLQLAGEQVIAGGANPELLDELRLNIEDLRQFLLADKERRFSLPLASYEDAERFLQKLKKTPKILAVSAPRSVDKKTEN